MEETLFGVTLGLAAGLNPGPLLTLVITATLRRGFAAGARVAMVPLVTDIPLIVISMLAVRQLPASWRAGIGIVGGAVVVLLAVRTWRDGRQAELPTASEGARPREFWRAAAVNTLNPNAWLFWTAVGAPLLVRTASSRPAAAIGFLAGFFGLLVGTKVVLAAVLARARHRLTRRGYRLALMGCAVLLFALGVWLAASGFRDLIAPPGS